jgi:hypothetical protein
MEDSGEGWLWNMMKEFKMNVLGEGEGRVENLTHIS